MREKPFAVDATLRGDDDGHAATERRRALDASASPSALLAVLAFADARLVAMHRLDSCSITVGRGSGCTIRLSDPGVSRRHLRIEPDGAGVIVRDLGSANGSHVRGQRVQHARLFEGDGIALGDALLRLVRVGSPEWDVHARVFECAHRDAVTGLLNRRGLRREIDALADGTALALLLIHADGLGGADAPMGPAYADELRRQLARLIVDQLPSDAGVAWLGDAQFAVLLCNVAAIDARQIAEHVRVTIAARRRDASLPSRIALSIGIARARVPATDMQALLLAAEHALYAARAAGGNRCVGP